MKAKEIDPLPNIKPVEPFAYNAQEFADPFNEENLKWVLENTAGWANFLACMKAYIEYGIQLRKGAYEFMRNKETH